MSNRVTLKALTEMEVGPLSELPIDQLAMLLDDVAAMKAEAKQHDEKLLAAMERRYSDRAREIRSAEGKDTGRVRITDGEYVVITDLPKKVLWSQPALRQAVETIRSWSEDPAEYVSTELKVAEAKYAAWPSTIRKLFEPARTVNTGRASYAIEPAKREVA